jgi:CPA2 family monovalent cation:H+ antiporter-2
MQHSVTLITTLAVLLGLALVLGFLAVRVKLPALVGYLVAGMIAGPATPGFVADVGLARQLADIGVMLLMFGIGLHFSFGDLLAVRRMVLPGAVVQMTLAALLGFAVALLWGWPTGACVVFGLALSVASTVVLLRALERRGILKSVNGRIAVAWLVVQDLAMVLVLVLLPPLSPWLGGAPHASEFAAAGLLRAVALTLGQVALFLVLMLALGRRLFPWFLWQVARTGSRELFTLCVIAAAVGIAYGAAELFGVSFALGAFLAGMVLGESHLSQRAAQESLPLRDAFSVLFFVSVGMLFDPNVLARQPLEVLTVVALIVLASPFAALAFVLAFRYPLNTALLVAAGLAQIGEFSYIVAGLGLSLGLLPADGQHLILAGSLITIAINPLLFGAIEPAQRWVRTRSSFARALERPGDPLAELPMTIDQNRLTGQAVLVGYGRVGRRIGEALAARGVPFVVAEQNREIVESLRARGIAAVSGNAAEPAVLIQAHIARARMLVIATPDTFQARQMMETARALNPGIDIVVRTHSDEEAKLLRAEGSATVFMGEHELALGMTRHVLQRITAQEEIEIP